MTSTSTTPDDHWRNIGRLLSRALQPRLNPAQDPLYAELISAYREDPSLRAGVRLVAEGMGLEVVHDSLAHGLVVTAAADGPFLSKMRDFRESMSVRDRLSYGLLMVALAAYVFPSADALGAPIEEAPPRVELNEVVPAIRHMCEIALREAESLSSAGQDTLGSEASAAPDVSRLGAHHLLALREVSREGDRSTLIEMLRRVCEHHVDTGLFQLEAGRHAKSAEQMPVYRPRPHYRLQIQQLSNGAHRLLLEHFQQASPS
jgi:hypothetical protein